MRRQIPPAPLPVRDGVAPSRVYLAPGDWPTLFDFLRARFPRVSPDDLQLRLARGDLVDVNGVPQRGDQTYRAHGWLWYYRDVPQEPVVPFDLPILYQDAHLVVVDKPHFLATTPGGRYLRETALTRLRHQLDLPQLSPVHRLDRETAGVLMFCVDPARRGAYQSLFQARQVQREYEAWAPWQAGLSLPYVHRSCLQTVPGHFVMHEVEGPANSETRITLLRRQGAWGYYRLQPVSGRKHQLRAHLSALGIPICHDRFYPVCVPEDTPDDYQRPLQLLARKLVFPDPYTGQVRCFESRRSLQGPIVDGPGTLAQEVSCGTDKEQGCDATQGNHEQ